MHAWSHADAACWRIHRQYKLPELKEDDAAAPETSAVAGASGAAGNGHRRLSGKHPGDAIAAKGAPAVAEEPEAQGARVEADAAVAANGETLWRFTGQESMHIFWAVDRLTLEELDKHNRQRTPVHGRPSPSGTGSAAAAAQPLDFNCELKDASFMSLIVGSLGQETCNTSVEVIVPVLTNSRDLAKGEYLLMEKDQKAAASKRTADWKSDADRAAQAAKKQAGAKAAPKKKPRAGECGDLSF